MACCTKSLQFGVGLKSKAQSLESRLHLYNHITCELTGLIFHTHTTETLIKLSSWDCSEN